MTGDQRGLVRMQAQEQAPGLRRDRELGLQVGWGHRRRTDSIGLLGQFSESSTVRSLDICCPLCTLRDVAVEEVALTFSNSSTRANRPPTEVPGLRIGQ